MRACYRGSQHEEETVSTGLVPVGAQLASYQQASKKGFPLDLFRWDHNWPATSRRQIRANRPLATSGRGVDYPWSRHFGEAESNRVLFRSRLPRRLITDPGLDRRRFLPMAAVAGQSCLPPAQGRRRAVSVQIGFLVAAAGRVRKKTTSIQRSLHRLRLKSLPRTRRRFPLRR